MPKLTTSPLSTVQPGIESTTLRSNIWPNQCFIADDLLEHLPVASQVGKTKVGGLDLNKPRTRLAAEAMIALSTSPGGFTASELAARVRALSPERQPHYGPRHAA